MKRYYAPLNEIEMDIAKAVAKGRIKVNEENGVKTNSKKSPEEKLREETDGVAGEIAFCKLFNLYPELEVDSYRDYDMLGRNDEFIEVLTAYENPTKSKEIG